MIAGAAWRGVVHTCLLARQHEPPPRVPCSSASHRRAAMTSILTSAERSDAEKAAALVAAVEEAAHAEAKERIRKAEQRAGAAEETVAVLTKAVEAAEKKAAAAVAAAAERATAAEATAAAVAQRIAEREERLAAERIAAAERRADAAEKAADERAAAAEAVAAATAQRAAEVEERMAQARIGAAEESVQQHAAALEEVAAAAARRTAQAEEEAASRVLEAQAAATTLVQRAATLPPEGRAGLRSRVLLDLVERMEEELHAAAAAVGGTVGLSSEVLIRALHNDLVASEPAFLDDDETFSRTVQVPPVHPCWPSSQCGPRMRPPMRAPLCPPRRCSAPST